MMSNDLAISINNISKKYFIITDKGKEDWWALRDVTINIDRGDVVGVIGRNGSGKTTLLKIIAAVTQPTTGFIDIYGKVGSMLELGAGFHPELSGRENIFLSGVILGLSKKEILNIYDKIVDFSELKEFMDMPVKHYSSGMYTRLAFSVSSNLNADILLIDEVLSVGDIAFQNKCLSRINEISASGKTILFVSHDLGAIKSICNKVLWLDHGKVVGYNGVDEVTKSYLES